ncbi:MAG: SDR family NAD(P)-dependent oxidoreductase [Gammaproteobacteria bacterium]|nr:SDR family NAD(P)-dependent oxidoreductase [Gammaproteobacteria bacterium]
MKEDNTTTIQPVLKNRIILISGAYGGIGRIVSKGFAAQGALVILLGRNIRKLTALYDEIEAADHPTPAIYPMDLTTATAQDFQTLEETLEKNFGRLDGLIHNAALLGSLTPLEYYPLEQWHQVMQVNVHSAFLLSQATLPLLKRSDQASIIFSNAAQDEGSKAYWGAYGISQWAREGLARMLAEECQTHTNIGVHCVHPHKVKTPLRHAAYPLEDKRDLLDPEAILPLYLDCILRS